MGSHHLSRDRPLTAGWAKGRGKLYARYWCYNKACTRVGISREGLEGHFVGLLGMMQPTAELIAKLPDIAESNWKVRSKRIKDEKRTLQNRLNENKALNLRAIEGPASRATYQRLILKCLRHQTTRAFQIWRISLMPCNPSPSRWSN